MGKVIYGTSISLDGFVAGPNDSPENPLGDGGERLFSWYSAGDTPYQMPGEVPPFMISKASIALLDEAQAATGAMVAGRRMFDIADAWQGRPPGGWPCFIVTHQPPEEWVKDGSPFTFVTDGVESAIRQARATAGEKNVAVASASIAQQCLNAGLLDEIHLDLTPVVLGGGVRLYDQLTKAPIDLERIHAIEATGVTHIAFRVIK